MKKIITVLCLGASLLGFSQIPKDSLVAHYSFSNHTDDVSGNQYNAKGENVELVADRYGNPNASYSLNGTNSAIVSEKPHDVKFPFTVSMWVNINKLGPGYSSLYSSDDKADLYSGFWINYSDKGRLSCGYGNGNGYNNPLFRYTKASPEGVLKENVWYHIVVSYISATEFQVYVDNKAIDGEYTGSAKDVKSLKTQSSFGRKIGTLGNQYHDGQIDDIYIYNKKLTERDITFLYYETPKSQVCEPNKVSVTDTLIIDMVVTSNTQLVKNTVKVYPNQDFITINTGKEDASAYTVKITTQTGQSVYESAMNAQELKVNLKDIGPAGLYFISIIDNQNQTIDTRKILLR